MQSSKKHFLQSIATLGRPDEIVFNRFRSEVACVVDFNADVLKYLLKESEAAYCAVTTHLYIHIKPHAENISMVN